MMNNNDSNEFYITTTGENYHYVQGALDIFCRCLRMRETIGHVGRVLPDFVDLPNGYYGMARLTQLEAIYDNEMHYIRLLGTEQLGIPAEGDLPNVTVLMTYSKETGQMGPDRSATMCPFDYNNDKLIKVEVELQRMLASNYSN